MFHKSPIHNATKSTSADSLQELVVNLDEHSEESLSGGTYSRPIILFAQREDLATLQRLQEEFAAELATLRGTTEFYGAIRSTFRF